MKGLPVFCLMTRGPCVAFFERRENFLCWFSAKKQNKKEAMKADNMLLLPIPRTRWCNSFVSRIFFIKCKLLSTRHTVCDGAKIRLENVPKGKCNVGYPLCFFYPRFISLTDPFLDLVRLFPRTAISFHCDLIVCLRSMHWTINKRDLGKVAWLKKYFGKNRNIFHFS